MPTRRYRYGFNGQEKDNEIIGGEVLNTAEFWQYDSRTGRRWNVDPVVKAHESSYTAFANNPIWFVDPLGNDTGKVWAASGNADGEFAKMTATSKQGDKFTVLASPTFGTDGKIYYAEVKTKVFHEGNDYADAGWYSEADYEYVNRDWANGQVLSKLGPIERHFADARSWGQWEVNADGYITDQPRKLVGYGPDPSGKNGSLLRQGEYIVYMGKKVTGGQKLLYIGKTEELLKRYTPDEIRKWGMTVFKIFETTGLRMPNNGIALGVEQLVIKLNNAGQNIDKTNKGLNLSNKINATVNAKYLKEAEKWLNTNIPAWKTTFKIQ